MLDGDSAPHPLSATNGFPGESPALDESGFIEVLKERYKCPRFRILVIGRANAGKTTILEKVCNVKQGTKPVIYDRKGVEIKKDEPSTLPRWRRIMKQGRESPGPMHDLLPGIFRGEHEIEHQITYPGSSFIFHDSRGFECGGTQEVKTVRNFLKERSNMRELKDQLHAIWYCVPMDTSRPVLPTEREFLDQGTGKVPLVMIYTKFDALVIQEYAKLKLDDEEIRWEQARANADRTFQDDYLKPVMKAKYPPNAFVRMEYMTHEDAKCSHLIEKTADVINIGSLRQLFTATQISSLHLCINDALE